MSRHNHRPAMVWNEKLIFGRVEFSGNEEHLQFQFKFLCLLLLGGTAATALFLIGNSLGLNPLVGSHLYSMIGFCAASIALWLTLRGNKHLFLPIAWAYEVMCLLEYISATCFVSGDELRLLWFFTNIPGVYILLGRHAGLSVAILTVVLFVFGNRFLPEPYSHNAVATAIVCLIFLPWFFHVLSSRSVSYFERMRASHQRLFALAMHDPLTGLLNARAYYEVCERMISLARRSGNAFSVLFVDLDHFKAINDTFGHAAGDIVLQRVADCLTGCIRQSDTLGRIGGEEFSILLPNTEPGIAQNVAETIRGAIETLMPEIDGGRTLRITASIGVAGNSAGCRSIEEIQQRADQAMYRAKAAGRNRVSVFDASGHPVAKTPPKSHSFGIPS